MTREPENAWIYHKYSEDIKRLKDLVDLIINEDSSRYLNHLPDSIYEISKRIVDYKNRKQELKKIDSYFDI